SCACVVLSTGCSWIRSLFFFFFQAEDGIRDRTVTGVQTCALPISIARPVERGRAVRLRGIDVDFLFDQRANRARVGALRGVEERSEERRVGKECRGGGAAYQ